MSSDISRQRFDPENNFNSVLMQQGRVQLDADWNEYNEILDRRWRSETIDIIGRGVVPRETPDGFALALSGGVLTIGRGRIYVDGLQAENHGGGAREFDPVLAESRGVDPIRYDEQPYLPKVPPLPDGGGPHLGYLDVWEREVTSVEDPRLVESAVGVDTTSRLQTVWQVRVLPRVGSGATCDAPDEDLPGWLDIIRPSAGRLTTAAVGIADPDDPCLIPPSGGYRGLENRTYRVEIHDAGVVGKATFKWSRDNASLAASVTRIEGDKTLTVDRAVWDSARRFSPGDWIEITDDWQELSQLPGEIRRIASVVDETRTIVLDAALTAGLFPVDGQNNTDPARHTRIKRWDQSGLVRDSGGATFIDLDAASSTGLIPVPPAGTSLLLEDGVQVTFTVDPAGGAFRAGDYWIFVARTADASVEALDAAPPRGIHHHYCRLGLITFPDLVIDCREFWPPLFGGESESCDCTLCVSAEQHNSGTFTIYQAVDQVRKTGGTICLSPGIFNLQQKPVHMDGAFAVRIRGQGAATVLIQPRADAAFIFANSQWCTLDYFTIHTIAGATVAPAIRAANCIGTTIERLIIAPPGEGAGPLAGLLLEPGFMLVTKIRDNLFHAQVGVGFSLDDKDEDALLLSSFYCERNVLQCAQAGIRLGRRSLYAADTVIARNVITDTTVAGIFANGLAFPELEVSGNTIVGAGGDGIVIGTGAARISDNRIVNNADKSQHGIRLVTGLVQVGVGPVAVSGNRLDTIRGDGVVIESLLISLRISGNTFNAIRGSGVTMREGAAVLSMSVVSNELVNVAAGTEAETRAKQLAAIYLRNVFEGAVSENAINIVGAQATIATLLAGIRVDNSIDVRINDNTITNLAPPQNFRTPAAGILIVGPIVSAEIANNLIRRQIAVTDPDLLPWQAIRIAGLTGAAAVGNRFTTFGSLSSAGQVNSLAVFAAAAATRREQAGVLGNLLDGFGGQPLAQVLINGTCRFSDNQCTTTADRLDIAVDVTATAIVASENRVECGPNTRALDLKTGAAKNSFTVLGNIVGGPIIVNGAALGAPWQPLNVVGV